MNWHMNGTEVSIVYKYNASRGKQPASWKAEMVKSGFKNYFLFYSCSCQISSDFQLQHFHGWKYHSIPHGRRFLNVFLGDQTAWSQ